MAFFEWQDDMSVGDVLIDSDHRALIAIINELHDMLETKINHRALADLFRELVTYTQYHFSREESVMQACHFPDFADHMREHGGFTQFIYDMRNKLARTVDKATLEEILDYLKAWLSHHILVNDAAYKPFIEGSSEVGPAAEKFGPGLAVVRGDEDGAAFSDTAKPRLLFC